MHPTTESQRIVIFVPSLILVVVNVSIKELTHFSHVQCPREVGYGPQ